MRVAELAIKFGEVERATQHPDGRPEGDATHTVMLALLALELGPPDLDIGELVINAVVHDLVEFDALDTCTARGLSDEERAAKEAREANALAKIKEMGLERLWSRIVRYERQTSSESRWVRYVDKVCPKLTHLMNRGAALRAIGMTAAEMKEKHAEQGAELAERYTEQGHARRLFEAACRACEDQLHHELDELGGGVGVLQTISPVKVSSTRTGWISASMDADGLRGGLLHSLVGYGIGVGEATAELDCLARRFSTIVRYVGGDRVEYEWFDGIPRVVRVIGGEAQR